MKRAIAAIVVGLGLLAAGWLAHQYGYLAAFFGSGSPGDSPATSGDSDDEGCVVAMGWLEPAGGLIDVSGPMGDRIETLAVTEGTELEEAQPLAYLEGRALRKLEMESVASQLREAQARYEAESKLADARITTAEQALKEATTLELDVKIQQKKADFLKASLELTNKDLQRLRGLSEEIVSEQERERQTLVVRQADTELRAAEATLEKVVRMHELGVEAARANLGAARASKQQVLTAIPVESLKKRLELAKTQWEKTVIVAPCKGTVLKVFMRAGESICTIPILRMADLSRMIAVAEVYETDAKRIRPRHPAEITSRAFPSPHDKEGLKGTVFQISKIVSAPGLRSLDPLARADRHVKEVRIKLDEASSRLAADFANLQVDVTFRYKR